MLTLRRRTWATLLPLGLVLLLLGWCYWSAIQPPKVRDASISLAGWPAGAPPLRVVLISDIHVAGPDMPPERLQRIVEQINRLRPDIVMIAGDFVSDKKFATRHYSMAEAILPLSRLTPRLGTFAVLGNHDHWTDDDFTGRSDLARTLAEQRRLRGTPVLLSHSPDPFAFLAPGYPLMLAGHTHCGQIAPPLIGAIFTMSRHGRRYACGLVRESGKVLVVSAGLGTSGVPLRLGAAPDLWLLHLGPG